MKYIFDIDGTICTTRWGDYERATPMPNAICRVNELFRGDHEIIFWSSRGTASGVDWRQFTEAQLKGWGVSYSELRFDRPLCDRFIGGNAIEASVWASGAKVPRRKFGRGIRSETDLAGNIAGGDPNTWEPELWEFLVQKFAVDAVLDLGCGEGCAMRHFRHLGCVVFGIEGWPTNATMNPLPCLTHDFARGPVVLSGFELVWSCEVVEHLDAKALEAFWATAQAGKHLAMTHAQPGQAGKHHVTLEPTEWWIAEAEKHGWQYMKKLTRRARGRARGCFFQETGLVFCRS